MIIRQVNRLYVSTSWSCDLAMLVETRDGNSRDHPAIDRAAQLALLTNFVLEIKNCILFRTKAVLILNKFK
jgi:hypothetical protein